MPLSRRATRRLRLGCCAVVVLMPILGAAIDDPHRVMARYTDGPIIRPTDTTAAGAELAAYLAARNPLVDRLLPEGEGGTRWHEELGPTAAGLAFPAAATIAIAIRHAPAGLESVEIHERAHLLHAAHPDRVERLLRRLPPPHPRTYAAENDREHFAEAAAGAWDLLHLPSGVCLADTPGGLLRDAEARVPGTAGFMVWYLRQPELVGHPDHAELSPIATELFAPYAHAWQVVEEAIADRRGTDGAFVPWPPFGLADRLVASYRRDRASDRWMLRLAAPLTLPAIGVATIIDRVR